MFGTERSSVGDPRELTAAAFPDPVDQTKDRGQIGLADAISVQVAPPTDEDATGPSRRPGGPISANRAPETPSHHNATNDMLVTPTGDLHCHWVPGVMLGDCTLDPPIDRPVSATPDPSPGPDDADLRPATPAQSATPTAVEVLPMMEELPLLPDVDRVDDADPSPEHTRSAPSPTTGSRPTATRSAWSTTLPSSRPISLDDLDPAASSALDTDDLPIGEPPPERAYEQAEIEVDVISSPHLPAMTAGVLFVCLLVAIAWYLAVSL